MKVESLKKVSNQYSIIKQVYEDRVLIRTSNLIRSVKYDSFMFLLSNYSCIWTYKVYDITFGKSQFEDTFRGYLVEVKPEDFQRIKTYENSFKNFNIAPEDEISSYEQLVKIAKEQEEANLVTKFNK